MNFIKKFIVIVLITLGLSLIPLGGCKDEKKEEHILSAKNIVLYEGESTLINVVSDVKEDIIWMNLNDKVCTVTNVKDSNYARIYGKSAGTTSVKAKINAWVGEVEIEVLKPSIKTAAINNAVTLNMDKGEKTFDLKIEPKGCNIDELSITTDNYSVAVVNNEGIITGKKSGIANILIKDTLGNEVSIKVSVINSEEIKHNYPKAVETGLWPTGHLQGLTVDSERKYMYLTYTTIFVKVDLDGNVIGSVSGYLGHMGDCTYNERDGKVYASLSCGEGEYGWKQKTAQYVAIIDVDKIIRQGMDAYRDEIIKTIFLKETFNDHHYDVDGDGIINSSEYIIKDGKKIPSPDRKYGTWGIDGMVFGPKFGSSDLSKLYLTISYSISRDETRDDNDYLIFLQYDVSSWNEMGEELIDSEPHKVGPDKPDGKYFLYTGNTDYGIQCMTYDWDRNMYVCVTYNYLKNSNGKKGKFNVKSNYGEFAPVTYLVDNSVEPTMGKVRGQENEYGYMLSFVKEGNVSKDGKVYGWSFWTGNTGIFYLGEDLYYVSHIRKEGNLSTSTVKLYRYTGSTIRNSNGNDLLDLVQ